MTDVDQLASRLGRSGSVQGSCGDGIALRVHERCSCVAPDLRQMSVPYAPGSLRGG